jgi:alpha-tubulin suppressor-like RCC1 family protein
MYNTILVLNSTLSVTTKDAITTSKHNNVYIFECDYSTMTYENLYDSLYQKYSEMELLGNELELNDIVIFNDNLEHTNYYFQMFGGEDKIMNNGDHFDSCVPLKNFVEKIKNDIPVQSLSFLDINHLYYSTEWQNIFTIIENELSLDDSTMKLNYLSKGWNNIEQKNLFYGSLNWLKKMYNGVNNQIPASKEIMNKLFDLLKITYHFNNVKDFDRYIHPFRFFIPESQIKNDAKIMFVPIIECRNDSHFAHFMQSVSKTIDTCFIFIEENETQESLAQKYLSATSQYFTGINTINKLQVGVYLPPYWNSDESPKSEIRLSKNMNTIPLNVSDDTLITDGSILHTMFQLMNSSQNLSINEYSFEIFNMNQNYTQSLDIIYQKLSEIPQYSNVTFAYSSVIKFQGIHHTYRPEPNLNEITQNPYMCCIDYNRGIKIYTYSRKTHNIENYIIIEDLYDVIERTKIQNVVLYDINVDSVNESIDKIQKCLTPNTVMIPFDQATTTLDEMKILLRNLNEEECVTLKKLAIIQDNEDNLETYSLFGHYDLVDIEIKDPSLNTWSNFVDFVSFLDQEIGIENLDMLMCKIYSDANWRYIIAQIESSLTTLNIRSSDDNTGHIIFDGDWTLESETVDVDMIRLYFTEEIKNVEIVLGYGGSVRGMVVVGTDQQSLYCVGMGINDDQTNGWDGTRNPWFRKVDLYSPSGVSYSDSFYVLEENEKITQLATFYSSNANSDGYYFMTSKNKLYAFGGDDDSNGSLGLGDRSDLPATAVNESKKLIKFPLLVKFEDGENIFNEKKLKSVHAAKETVYVLFDDGDIYCCGNNTFSSNGTWENILGYNSLLSGKSHINYFVKYEEPDKDYLFGEEDEIPVRICGGRCAMLILTNKNKLYSQGYSNNTYGSQTGRGGANRRDDIGLVEFDNALNSDEYVVHVCSGHNISACLTNQGRIFTCGDNFQSPLAQNTTSRSFNRMNLIHNYENFDTEKTVKQMFTGTQTLFVLFDDNTLWSSGDGGGNQNRNLHGGDKTVLTEVNSSFFGDQTVEERVSFYHSVHAAYAITDTTKLWAWGYNKYLTLGSKNTSTTQKWSNPGQPYLGNTTTRVTDVLFGPQHHEHVLADEFDNIISQNEFLTDYEIPLISEFHTIADESGNYFYHPLSDKEYSPDVSFVMNIGVFKIKNVPTSTPIAVLNDGQTDKISYFGTKLESNQYGPDGVTYYDFYSGDVYIQVDASFDATSIYTSGHSGSYLGTENKITFSLDVNYTGFSLVEEESTTRSLGDSNVVNLFRDASNELLATLSNLEEISGNFFDDYQIINNGTIKIAHIPPRYPIAIIENTTSNLTVSGASSSEYTVDGVSRTFYDGSMEIVIPSYGFSDISLLFYDVENSTAMLSKNIIFNPISISIDSSAAVTQSLPYSSFFQIYPKSSSEVYIHFTQENELSGNFTNSFTIGNNGIYEIKNIPEKYMLNISEQGTSFIEITGTDSSMSSYTVDSQSLDFYHGNMYLKLGDNDADISLNMTIYDTVNATHYDLGTKAIVYKNIDSSGLTIPRGVLPPDDFINFKYQPYAYTLSGNENFYVVGATLVAGDLIFNNNNGADMFYDHNNGTSYIQRFFVKDSGGFWGRNNNAQPHITSFNDSNYYSVITDTTQDLSYYQQNYEYFMYFAYAKPKANPHQAFYYLENGTKPERHPNYPSPSTTDATVIRTDLFSHFFAFSFDNPLTEDSILFPVDMGWNPNHYNPRRYIFYSYLPKYDEATNPMTQDEYERYYDYCRHIADNHTEPVNGSSVHFYALKFDNVENVATYSNPTSTTKLCLTLDVPESIENVGPYTVLDLHPTVNQQEYIQSVEFGMAKDQTYVIDAPQNYPLAFVGKESQTDISYSGYSSNLVSTIDISGVTFPLYSGPIFIQLNGDISENNTFTFYTTDGEDLNTTNKMYYNSECSMIVDDVTQLTVEHNNDYEYEVRFFKSGSSILPRFDSLVTSNAEATVYEPLQFRYIYFKNAAAGSDKYFHVQDVQCWIDDMNVSAASNGATAVLTDVGDIESTHAYSTNNQSNPASNAIDNDSTNASFVHGNGDVNSLLIELPYNYDAKKLQRLIVYNRKEEGTNLNLIRGRYHGVEYLQLLDENKEVVLEIDQTATVASDFEQIDHINYIGPSDNVLSSTYDIFSTANKDYNFVITSDVSSSNNTNVFNRNTKFPIEQGVQYSLNKIPPWYPITILNDGLSDKIELTGDSDKVEIIDVSGVSYSFYYGDVKINVYDTSFGSIDGLSLFTSFNGGTYVGSQNMIFVGEQPIVPNDELPLHQISRVNVVEDSTGDMKYTINGKNLYISDLKFGFTIGTYVFTNVPEAYAMAIMNNGKESIIEYTGDTLKGSATGPDGNTYDFYYGSVTMQVKSIDGILDEEISICSYNNGYMGGNGLLKGMDESHYNVMEQNVVFDSYQDAAQSNTSAELRYLQAEFIAGTSTSWTANYMKSGSNGSTTFTNAADLVHGSDSDGNYFKVNTTSRGAYLNTYPNVSRVLQTDNDGTDGLTFEVWFKTPTSLSSTNGWLIGFESGWGPYITLQDSRMGGMGTTPGASDNNTYSGLSNPGYINNNLNKLIHIVGYWKRNGTYFDRGIFVNGEHYPQESSLDSGNSDFPVFDNFNKKFAIGNLYGTSGHHSNGTQIYSFRIWHTKLEQGFVTSLYNKGTHTSALNESGIYTLPYKSVDLNYQPFDYTASSNENFYVRGATMLRDNIQVDSLSTFTDYTSTENMYVYRLMFSLKNAHSGARWSVGTSNAHILALYDESDTITRDTTNANATNEALSELYDYYMRVAATGGNTVQEVYQDEEGNPTHPDGTALNTYHTKFTSIFSHRFALSTDSELTEDSILYPIHYIHNAHDWNGGSRYLFTTYYYTSDKLGTSSDRHSDWNAQLVNLGGMLATNTNVYLYALDLGINPINDPPSVSMLPQTITYTDSSGVDASFSNPNTYQVSESVTVVAGQFKYIYVISDSTYNTLVIRELECYVNGVNVALSSSGATAVWTKSDINTTTTSAHGIGASTKANDGTIVKNGTDDNLAHANGGNGWTRLLISLPQTYNVRDVQRIVHHSRHQSANYDYYSAYSGKSIAKIQLLDEYKSTVVAEWDNTSATFNGDATNPEGTYLGIFEINFLGPADDPSTTDFTIYNGSDTADVSLSTVTYEDLTTYETKYTYYSECLIDGATATVVDTDASGASVILLNNDTVNEDLKVYSVYDGSYSIVLEDASNAIALLNHDVSNAISYTGTTLSTTKQSVYDSDHTYNYYSGTITLEVNSSFSDVLLFEHLDASLIDTKFSKLMYSKTCDPGILQISADDNTQDASGSDEIVINSVCLNNTSEIKVALQSATSSKYILNYTSGDAYDATLHYGLNIGNYKITNIPSEYPLAIFNSSVSDKIEYTGTNAVGSKYSVVGQGTYTYYSGTVYITVKEIPTNVSALSYGSLNDSSLLETNKFIFDTDCTNDGTYTVGLTSSTTLDVTNDGIISLNNDTFDDDINKPGVHDGYYMFTNVSSTTPIAFASDDTTLFSYTGLSYKSSTHNILMQTTTTDASGVSTTTTDVSYDDITFYYGDVELYVKGQFEELSLYVYTDGSFIRQKLHYSDFCEDFGYSSSQSKTITCLNRDSSMNIVLSDGYKMVLNNGTTYDSKVAYGVNIGSYTIQNVSPSYAFKFSNDNAIDASMTYMESLSTFTKVESDISYNYYYGNVDIHFNEDLSETNPNIMLSFYDASLVTNSDDFIVFTNECQTDESYYVECLDISSSLSISDSNNLLNGNSEYDSYKKFGLHIGTYQIHDISINHPVAILNHDISDILVVSGESEFGTKFVNDVSYTFYTGTITLNVTGDFSSVLDGSFVSLYDYYDGYLNGGQDAIVFTDVCEEVGDGYYFNCLDTETSMTFTDDSKILLNGDTQYNAYQKYAVSIGDYTISDVPEDKPITLVTSTPIKSSSYTITGTTYAGEYSVLDVSYDFYSGTVTLRIMEDISAGDSNTLSFMTTDGEFLGTEDKFVYKDDCGNVGDADFSYVICLDETSTVNTVLVDSSYYYAFNSATEYFDYKRFGVHVGSYTITNIPIISPMAFINNDISNNVEYSGDSNKKFTSTGPDGNTYDFYYGDITLKIYGDFGSMSAYSYRGHYAGTENQVVFTDACEVDGKVTQCMDLDTSYNKYDNKFTFNAASEYNEYIQYGVTTGTYTISNIPSDEALGFITHDISDSVEIYGANEDLCGNFTGPDGNSYDFYTNKIQIIVKDEFSGYLKLYSKADASYNNGETLIKYTSTCDSINSTQKFKQCIDSTKTLTVAEDSTDASYIVLDSSLNYNEKREYGVYNGTYTFDVPSTHPIAFLNSGNESNVIYQGNESNKTRTAGPSGDTLYDYYYGKVTLTVMGDFGSLSYHILNQGYMGGESVIVYTDKCDIIDVTHVVECLTSDTSMSMIEVDGSLNYTLNGNTTINDFVKFGLHDGNYVIQDICDNYPIAIMNYGKEEHIHFSGDTTDLCGNFTAPDGNTYEFYKNKINVTVNSDFSSDVSGISIFVYGDASGYYGMEEKLVYSDICQDSVTTERVTTNNDVTLIKFNKLKYSTYKKYGNNSYFI